VTVRYSTARSRRNGALVGLGVTSAIAIWASMSMFGLVALLSQVSWLYDSVRLAGGLYLAYLRRQQGQWACDHCQCVYRDLRRWRLHSLAECRPADRQSAAALRPVVGRPRSAIEMTTFG
jgi:hypothetical protein